MSFPLFVFSPLVTFSHFLLNVCPLFVPTSYHLFLPVLRFPSSVCPFVDLSLHFKPAEQNNISFRTTSETTSPLLNSPFVSTFTTSRKCANRDTWQYKPSSWWSQGKAEMHRGVTYCQKIPTSAIVEGEVISKKIGAAIRRGETFLYHSPGSSLPFMCLSLNVFLPVVFPIRLYIFVWYYILSEFSFTCIFTIGDNFSLPPNCLSLICLYILPSVHTCWISVSFLCLSFRWSLPPLQASRAEQQLHEYV